jgi:DNA polymerase III subunit gamma/tau
VAKKKATKVQEPEGPSNTLSLAVKYRPRVLKDVVGNPQEVAVIKGMIKTRKFPGAILLSGATGCGKTTLARILAAYMNADDPKRVTESLSYKLGDKHPDVTVVNAGTQGKVEDIRTVVKGSKSAPMTNYRIIIIDEAHKLTGASAEAILLPLEEPAPHTIWILCTTNPEKLLKTIVDRCTTITLRTVEPEQIVERLTQVAELEGMKFIDSKDGKKALKLIAQFSDGSVRGGLAILEKLMYAAASGDLDLKEKGALAHYVESAAVDLDKACASVIAAALNRDLPGCISIIRKAENPRGIVYKSRMLIDYLIGKKTKTAKFTPYAGRVFESVAEKMGIKYNLMVLIMLQEVVNNVELAMNSCAIDEAVLLQTHVGKFIIDNLPE